MELTCPVVHKSRRPQARLLRQSHCFTYIVIHNQSLIRAHCSKLTVLVATVSILRLNSQTAVLFLFYNIIMFL
jgi:hypothetical protein